MDNYAAHKHDNVQRWLAGNPRVALHFSPTRAAGSTSWRCSSIITCQAMCRGSFDSVPDLIDAIDTLIQAWNEPCQPWRCSRHFWPRVRRLSTGVES
jgi:hypothetical protein